MRIAAFVLSLLAGVAFIALGVSWLGEMDGLRASVAPHATETTDAEFTKFVNGTYAMIAAGIGAFGGGILALLRKARLAGGALVVSCALVGVLAPRFVPVMLLLVVLIVATALAFLSHQPSRNEGV